MKANELRIGNWVQAPGGSYEQVYSVMTGEEFNPSWGPDGIYEDFKYADVTGIPLTPEVLAKAGFEKEDMHDLGICIFHIVHPELWLSLNEGSIWIGEYDTRCKYLHQLQNLYFALTGEELKIEL